MFTRQSSAAEKNGKSHAAMPFFQAKLTVNTPGDAYEQEADAVADQVMRMNIGDAPIVQRMSLTPVGGVMRSSAECENKKKEGLQRKETSGGHAGGNPAPSIVNEVLSSSGGQPMESGTRQFMESRFGQDFSSVRIHTSSRAAESAMAIHAKAYTSGQNVVFGAGQYQPESEKGKRLLAHELAHVGQQREVESIQRKQDEDGHETDFGNMDMDHDELGSVAQEMLNTVGYDYIIQKGLESGLLTHGDSGPDRKVQRQTFSEAFTPYAVAAGVSALADSPVPGPGDVVAIGILVVGLIAAGVIVATSTRSRVCPPCPAPPGPEVDQVPPSTPHFPCPGDHWHYYEYNQNPSTCQCFGPRRLFGGCCGTPGAPC